MEATAQVAATNAAASEGAPSAALDAPVSAASHGLDAVLGDLSVEDVETGDDGAAEAADGDPAEAAPDGETPEPGKKGAPDELIFSDEQLKTPEGIRRARDRVKELRKMQHEAYIGLKQHERNVRLKHEKLKHKVATFRSEKATHSLLIDNVRSNLQGLHSGDPETILTALGNLTGTDGLKAYEQLTSRIVNKGRSPLDPQVQAIIDQQQKQIEELKNGFTQREQQELVQQKARQITQHEQRIGEMIRASTSTPHLTRVFNDDPARLTKYIVDAITEDNGATPAPQLFEAMERELQQHFGAAAPQGNGGGPAQKQPATAQRSPGQSVGPSRTAASTARVPSEEESLRALANDTELLSALGL